MAGIDPRTEVPPPGLVVSRQHWRPPFVYSEADVMRLMAQVRPPGPLAVPGGDLETLIGLLASTGLRVGEAIGCDAAPSATGAKACCSSSAPSSAILPARDTADNVKFIALAWCSTGKARHNHRASRKSISLSGGR